MDIDLITVDTRSDSILVDTRSNLAHIGVENPSERGIVQTDILALIAVGHRQP